MIHDITKIKLKNVPGEMIGSSSDPSRTSSPQYCSKDNLQTLYAEACIEIFLGTITLCCPPTPVPDLARSWYMHIRYHLGRSQTYRYCVLSYGITTWIISLQPTNYGDDADHRYRYAPSVISHTSVLAVHRKKIPEHTYRTLP